MRRIFIEIDYLYASHNYKSVDKKPLYAYSPTQITFIFRKTRKNIQPSPLLKIQNFLKRRKINVGDYNN